MALAREASGGAANNGSGGAISTAFTVTAANLLLVGVTVGDDGFDATAVTPAWNGTPLTLVASSAISDGAFTATAWYRLNSPAAGTFNVTLAGGTHTQCAVHIISFTGASLTLGTPSTATNTTANPSVTVAASASGDIVVAALATDNATADTVAANSSIFDGEDVGADTDHNSQYVTASGANTAMAWTNSGTGSGWAASGLAISAAATITQEGFRFGVDDGNEAAHGFEAAQDTDITILDDQSRLLRAIVDTSGNAPATAFTLRVQKNGSGGYTAVPVGATVTTSPPTAPTATVTTVSTAVDPWTINRPAASTGDLIVFVLAWDDSVTVSSVTAPSGVNGETAVSIAGPIASASTEMREQAWYYLATGAWTTGTLSFDPSAAETARAVAFVIPTGQFKASDPIGFANTRASALTTETSVLSPTGTAESDDTNGRLYIAFGSDADAITVPGSNWNTINNATGGGVGLLVGTRNALVTSSESITALTATIASDSWATLCFVVKPNVVANEVYVVASANIAAGGEATTARLTAPAGKTTSDFTTGRRWDDENGTDSVDIATDFYTELEWLVYIAASAVNGDFYDFHVYAGAAALDTYAVTPRWTIGTSGGRTVNAATEALTLTRQNASVARSRALSAATEALTLTRQNATVARSRGVAAATEALALTAQPSSIGRARGVVAATEALVLVGLAATVTFETTNDREVGATAELLTLTGQPATIATGRGVNAGTEALTLTSFAATVKRGSVLTTAISRSSEPFAYVPRKSPLNTDPVLRSYAEREFQAVARALASDSADTFVVGDVMGYGAVGDGVTDDTAAFVAAQTAAAAVSRTVTGYSDPRSSVEISIPPGTYLITSPKALMDASILASKQFGLSFRGAGYGLTDILYHPSSSGPLCENQRWLGVRFYGIGFSCDDAASDFMASDEQGGATNIQDYGFTDCSWAGTWRYINVLTGDNNNSEWLWEHCWVSGNLTTFLYVDATGTSDQFLNYWFSHFKFWPASGSWIDMAKGGHVKITDCDSSGWEPTSQTYLFNLRGDNHFRGVLSFKASGLRVEQKTTDALVLFSEWPHGNISFRDCDFGSQASLVGGAALMVSAVFAPGETPGASVIWSGCVIMGTHDYTFGTDCDGMNRVLYENCEFANITTLTDGVTVGGTGVIEPVRLRLCLARPDPTPDADIG